MNIQNISIKDGKLCMKVRDFIQLENDIDVYDDVCEELGICFCGAMGLTEDGEKVWADVMDYDMELDISGQFVTAIVHVDDDDEKTWKRRLKRAKEFFYSAAGYCADEDYNKWFKFSD
jgi:hypothetical protein